MRDYRSSQDEMNKSLGVTLSEAESKQLDEDILNRHTSEDFTSQNCFPTFINYPLQGLYSSFFYSIAQKVENSIGPTDRGEVLSLSNDCYSWMKIKILSFKELQEELKDPESRRTLPPCPYTPIIKEAFLSENDNIFFSTSLECLNDCLNNNLDEEFSNIHDFALTSLVLKPVSNVIKNESIYKKPLQYENNGKDLYFDQTLLKARGDVYDQWIKIEIPVNAFTHSYYLCISMKVKTILSLINIEYPINLFPDSSYYEDKNFVLKMCKMNLSEEYISKLKDGDILDFNCSVDDKLTFYVNNKLKGEGNLVRDRYSSEEFKYFLHVSKIFEDECEDEKDDFNSYVALNYDKIDEDYKIRMGSVQILTTIKSDLLPLVHNGNIVAMVRMFKHENSILFKIFHKF